MAATKPLPSWKLKFIAPFRASPGKSGVLIGLAVLLICLWVKMMVGAKGPAAAHAASAPETMSISRTLEEIQNAPIRRQTSQANSLEQWARQQITPVKRNLFSASLELYPLENAHRGDISPVGDGFWDRLAKSMSAQADQEEQRQVKVNNLRTEAASLKLQSTMVGGTDISRGGSGASRGQSKAMVNGEMVHEGSVVAGFRVVKIETRRMIVEREGIQLEIVMN